MEEREEGGKKGTGREEREEGRGEGKGEEEGSRGREEDGEGVRVVFCLPSHLYVIMQRKPSALI